MVIPVQGVVAGQSLLSIEDTIPSTKNGKINEFKLSRVANQLSVMAEAQGNALSYQTKPFATNVLAKFKQLTLDDARLYELSRALQGGKGADGKSPSPQFANAGIKKRDELLQAQMEDDKRAH
ncbi:MAG TPA: hypothetical protein PLD88_00615, partial [Candidatus Berkiella sp.]|nr:hypothetical protein [Candidatus Berkiella sp.]